MSSLSNNHSDCHKNINYVLAMSAVKSIKESKQDSKIAKKKIYAAALISYFLQSCQSLAKECKNSGFHSHSLHDDLKDIDHLPPECRNSGFKYCDMLDKLKKMGALDSSNDALMICVGSLRTKLDKVDKYDTLAYEDRQKIFINEDIEKRFKKEIGTKIDCGIFITIEKDREMINNLGSNTAFIKCQKLNSDVKEKGSQANNQLKSYTDLLKQITNNIHSACMTI